MPLSLQTPYPSAENVPGTGHNLTALTGQFTKARDIAIHPQSQHPDDAPEEPTRKHDARTATAEKTKGWAQPRTHTDCVR